MMTKMNYEQMVPSCFGCTDFKFAYQTADAKRAAELLSQCVSADVRFTELKRAVTEFLNSKTKDKGHIEAQLERLRARFEVWLEP